MAAALRPLMGPLMTGFRWLSLAPTLTLLLFVGPVAAGLLGTLMPAFGWWPDLGGTQLGLDAWRALAAVPGLLGASLLSLWVGLGATLLALGAAVGLAAALEGTVWQRRLEPLLSLLLATPHGAFAVGMLFLISPSGWLVRLFSPWATGWAEPPDLMLVNDPQGLALLLALAAKECFFLLLMLQAARHQVPVAERLRLARTLGYGRFTGWFKTVLPALYPQIRLPVLAALAFGLSVVDMAIVLGPATPPPLALQILDLIGDPDLTHRFTAAAAALLLVGLVLAAIAVWCAGERIVGVLGRHWAATGRRRDAELAGQGLALLGFVAAAAIGLSLLLLALWSLAGAWRYPDALPQELTTAVWQRTWPPLTTPLLHSIGLAAVSALLALGLALACLEQESRSGRPLKARALALLYLPLLVPQIGFLFGVQVLAARLDLVGTFLAVAWVHLLFVLPYVFLTLGDAWRALDPRFARIALCLGRRPATVFWRVKLPLLKGPVAASLAIGFAVSIGLYLPAVLLGAGRMPTLASEVVALSAGGDRRQLGAFAFLQAALPLLALAAALRLGHKR